MRIVRLALPLLAVVGIAVGAACTPVKQQFGKNIPAYVVTNGCLPGTFNNEPQNIYWSPSPFSREVCSNGFAWQTPGANGVTLQIVNSNATGGAATFGSTAGFVIGGVYQLGDINSMKINVAPGSDINVMPALLLDKNNDGQFLCPPDATGKTTGFCGDAFAQFLNSTGHSEHVYENTEELFVAFAPCNGPFGGLSCLHGPSAVNAVTKLAELKGGLHAGIDGFTKALIVVNLSGNDAKATVTGVEVNGVPLLP